MMHVKLVTLEVQVQPMLSPSETQALATAVQHVGVALDVQHVDVGRKHPHSEAQDGGGVLLA